MRISKRAIKAIQTASVFDAVLRERHESSLTGHFADHAPDSWSNEEREAFDMATEVEYRMKNEILRILGVPDPTKGA